jgi:hypothetical protein
MRISANCTAILGRDIFGGILGIVGGIDPALLDYAFPV